MNNILIAPDKFKFTLSANKFINAVSEGFDGTNNNLLKIPLADGGEGTAVILAPYYNAKKVFVKAKNPLFKNIIANYYFSKINKIAIIDLASASGLFLLNKEDQNPLQSSTYGTGEIILDAIKNGATEIIIAMGGSATNDCGIGMATALGYRFIDKEGRELQPIGKNLIKIAKIIDINVTPSLNNIKFTALFDVSNELFGKNGAAYTYAKQKGANTQQIKDLDEGLQHFSNLIKQKYNTDVSKINGGGAAGGFGVAAFIFLNSQLKPGSNFIFNILKLESYIKKCNLIITGEGKFDKQSLKGKVVGTLLKKANLYNIPIAVVCGQSEIKNTDLNYNKLKIYPLFKNSIDMEIAKQITYKKIVAKVKNEIINEFLN